MQSWPRSSLGSRFKSGARTSRRTRSPSARSLATQVHIVARALGKPVRVAAATFELACQALTSFGESVRGRVVRRGKPAVSSTRNPAQSGARAPASDPQRYAAPLSRSRRELDIGGHAVGARPLRARPSLEQCPQRCDGLVKPLPALLERDAEGVVVAFGRTRSQGSDQSALGEHIQRGQRLCQRYRPPQDRERDGSGQSHVAGPRDHARKRCRPVEPGPREDEMVVGRDGREPALPSRVNRPLEPPEREPFVSELHQRQINPQINESIVSDFAPSASGPAAPAAARGTDPRVGRGREVVPRTRPLHGTSDAGGRARTPDTRIMIPLRFGTAALRPSCRGRGVGMTTAKRSLPLLPPVQVT